MESGDSSNDYNGNLMCEFLTDNEGREIQKISVIRNLSDIMEAHPRECATQLLPVVQRILQDSSASLDLHCEGAIAYRNILTDKALLEIDTNISQLVLQGAVSNFSHAPEDSYPFIAWTETLLEIADSLTAESFRTQILPVAITQSQQSRPVKSRIASIKLLEKLAAKLSPNEVKTSVVPSVQSLCQDVNAQVRASICERLPTIAKTLNCVEYKMVILPLMVELCNDEDLTVQERALDSIRNSLPYFDKDTVRNVVVPLFKRSAEKSMQICDTNLAVISKNLGPWIYEIHDVITDEQKSWFLLFFVRLAKLGTCSQDGTNSDAMTRSDPDGFAFNNPFDSDPVQVACRDWCAYNFPGMVHMYGVDAFQSHLLPVFTKLCQDSEEGIRKSIAAGFHELVKLLDKTPHIADLISSFIDLIRLGDPDVVGKLTSNMTDILPIFYEHFAKMIRAQNDELDSNGNVIQKKTQLNRILLACNRLVRNNSNWRAHEDFLGGIGCLVSCADSFEDMQASFVPLLKEEVLTSRAIPCRIAAARTLLMFMRYSSSKKSRISIIEFFIQTLAHHQSCHKRSLFLDVCREVLGQYSRYFFKKHFLHEAIKLLEDRIPNVRIKACKLLPLMKKSIILPLDEPLLSSIESAVKKLLEKEQSQWELKAAQQVAAELSAVETGEIEDPIDRKKLAEEFNRYGSPELVASCHEFRSTNQRKEKTASPPAPAVAKPPIAPTPSSDTNSLLPPTNHSVRIRKPRTAIVRPQPKVIVMRSPSPRPDTEKEPSSPEKENSNVPADKNRSVKRMTNSASESDLKSGNSSIRRSTMLRPPTPVHSPRRTSPSTHNDSPRPNSTRTRTAYRSGTVRQAAQKWESNPTSSRANVPLSFDANGNNSLTRLTRSASSTNTNRLGNLSNNSSSSFSPRSSIPVASYIRRGSLPGQNGKNAETEENKSGTEYGTVSVRDRDNSLPRRSYGLMKVQSASAIQQSSASTVSMRARRKF